MRLRQKGFFRKTAAIMAMVLLVGCAAPRHATQTPCVQQTHEVTQQAPCPQEDKEEEQGPDGFLMFAVIGAIIIVGITIHGT